MRRAGPLVPSEVGRSGGGGRPAAELGRAAFLHRGRTYPAAPGSNMPPSPAVCASFRKAGAQTRDSSRLLETAPEPPSRDSRNRLPASALSPSAVGDSGRCQHFRRPSSSAVNAVPALDCQRRETDQVKVRLVPAPA